MDVGALDVGLDAKHEHGGELMIVAHLPTADDAGAAVEMDRAVIDRELIGLELAIEGSPGIEASVEAGPSKNRGRDNRERGSPGQIGGKGRSRQ